MREKKFMQDMELVDRLASERDTARQSGNLEIALERDKQITGIVQSYIDNIKRYKN